MPWRKQSGAFQRFAAVNSRLQSPIARGDGDLPALKASKARPGPGKRQESGVCRWCRCIFASRERRIVFLLLVMLSIYGAQANKAVASWVTAIDSANWIDEQRWFNQAYGDGVRLYIVHSTWWGTCKPWPHTKAQLAMALKAGIKVAVYTRDPRCWRTGILAAGRYRSLLQFYAIDIETDPGVRVTSEMVQGIKSMGVRPVIYTSPAMWQIIMGNNVSEFSDIPLWDADLVPFERSTLVQYGGWNSPENMRIGVPKILEYPLRGINVDFSYFNSEFLR